MKRTKLSNGRQIPTAPAGRYDSETLAAWRDDLQRIRAVAHRRRLLGHPDIVLELGCAILGRRLERMRRGEEHQR